MRLFVNKSGCKTYIAASAVTRWELSQKLGDPFRVKVEDVWYDYSIGDVYAEPAGHLAIAGMMIGGLIGLVGGPIGVILGALFGYLLGMHEDIKEKDRAVIFNETLEDKR